MLTTILKSLGKIHQETCPTWCPSGHPHVFIFHPHHFIHTSSINVRPHWTKSVRIKNTWSKIVERQKPHLLNTIHTGYNRPGCPKSVYLGRKCPKIKFDNGNRFLGINTPRNMLHLVSEWPSTCLYFPSTPFHPHWTKSVRIKKR